MATLQECHPIFFQSAWHCIPSLEEMIWLWMELLGWSYESWSFCHSTQVEVWLITRLWNDHQQKGSLWLENGNGSIFEQEVIYISAYRSSLGKKLDMNWKTRCNFFGMINRQGTAISVCYFQVVLEIFNQYLLQNYWHHWNLMSTGNF